MDPFSRQTAVIETDGLISGTPFRVCTFRVTGGQCGKECVQKVRAALQVLITGCEVQELPGLNSPEARKLGVRFKLRYYGAQTPGEKIKEAIEKALRSGPF